MNKSSAQQKSTNAIIAGGALVAEEGAITF